MCLCWEMEEVLQCPVWKLETRSMLMRLWEKGVDWDCCNAACRGILLLTLSLHAKWTLPQNQLSKVGVKLVAKGSAGSWTAPNSRSRSPLPWFAQAAHRLHTDGSIPTGAPTSESRWQWAALPAPSLMDLLSTSLKLSAIIPLFAFHLHKVCLLVYHGCVFYPAEQENDCMHSCSSYCLGHGFASYTNHCSLPKCQLTGT